MLKTQEGWISEYQGKNALWIHDGNPRRPHALLRSGQHSNGFFNSRLVIPDEGLLRSAAWDLLELFAQNGGFAFEVQLVVGPQTGATKLAELLSGQISILNPSIHGDCFWASPAKSEKDGQKSMVFSYEDLDRLPGQHVLLCEDVLTTGGSVDLAAQAVVNAGGIVLPFILVLVNRSGLTEVDGKQIIALIDHPMPVWASEDCPLCAQGSEAVSPKDNWALLNASY